MGLWAMKYDSSVDAYGMWAVDPSSTPIVNAYGMWAVDPSRVLKALAKSLSIRIMVFNAKDEILTELLPTPDAEIEFTAYVLCVPTISNVTKAYALEAALPILTNNNAPEEVLRQNRINPGELHWTAVKNILKYLRNTKDMFLVYGENPSTELRVECYCDAGFETDRDDTKSQTGYVFVLNGGAVDWKSSKQSTIAMSATESEYIAASEAAMEAVWIRKFISGLGIVPTINEPINMYCDNSAAVHYANEPGVQRGARHYLRKYHYVRESVALGEIKILKVHTDNNLADPFTKALSNRKLTQHARSMGLHPASSFM
ncbi:hypothetical protein Tco_0614751 [Tanacetum coccineum]